jgi:hypothetical protein
MVKGDMFIVPKGLRHRPVCEKAEIMMIESTGTVNTGDLEGSDLTVAAEDVRTV